MDEVNTSMEAAEKQVVSLLARRQHMNVAGRACGEDDDQITKTAAGTPKVTGGNGNKTKKAQKPRRRVATLAQRRAANIRERRRMFNLNGAFDRLRKKVPSFAYEKRLSRIETLKLAIMYIRFMDDLVNDESYIEKYKQLTAGISGSSVGLLGASGSKSPPLKQQPPPTTGNFLYGQNLSLVGEIGCNGGQLPQVSSGGVLASEQQQQKQDCMGQQQQQASPCCTSPATSSSTSTSGASLNHNQHQPPPYQHQHHYASTMEQLSCHQHYYNNPHSPKLYYDHSSVTINDHRHHLHHHHHLPVYGHQHNYGSGEPLTITGNQEEHQGYSLHSLEAR